MLPLSLFRERNFTIGNLATLTAYLGLGGVIFLLPVFLQEVSGYSPVQAGLALLPVTSLLISSLAASARSPTASARGCR